MFNGWKYWNWFDFDNNYYATGFKEEIVLNHTLEVIGVWKRVQWLKCENKHIFAIGEFEEKPNYCKVCLREKVYQKEKNKLCDDFSSASKQLIKVRKISRGKIPCLLELDLAKKVKELRLKKKEFKIKPLYKKN